MARLKAQFFRDHYLRAYAGQAVFLRGQQYYQDQRAELVQLETEHARLHVMGTQLYAVDIEAEDDQFYASCTCAHAESGYFCKHMVAAGMLIRQQLRSNDTQTWKDTLGSVIDGKRSEKKVYKQKPYFLMFSVQKEFASWSIQPYTIKVSDLSKGNGNLETDALDSLVRVLELNPWLGAQARQPTRALQAAECVNCEPALVSLANIIARTERGNSAYHFYGYTRPLEDYFALLAGEDCPIYFGDAHQPLTTPLQVLSGSAGIQIHAQRNGDGGVHLDTEILVNGQIIPLVPGQTSRLTESPLWLMAGEHIVKMKSYVSDSITTKFLENPQLTIPKQSETEFLEGFLIPLADNVPIRGEQVQWEHAETTLTKRLYLIEEGGKLYTELRFGYGEAEVSYEKSLPEQSIHHKTDGDWTLVRVIRFPEKEGQIHRNLSSPRYGLKRALEHENKDLFTLRARIDPVDFLLRNIPNLIEDGFEIFGEEDLEAAQVTRRKPTIHFSVTSGFDWFDLNTIIRFGDVDVSLQEIRLALRKKKKYVKLADGTVGELPEAWIRKYKSLFSLGKQNENGFRFASHHLTMIDELLASLDSSEVDAEYVRRIEELKQFSGIPKIKVPEGFVGELRPYQRAGLDWLYFLKNYKFGGCLADDMGLGKTIQVLALLISLKEGGADKPTSLIVVPRSLLVNWKREADRFTPDLRVHTHFGARRSQNGINWDDYDIVLTTYGTMRRDIQHLRNHEFNYLILDESQAIKNPAAQVSKAVRLLRGKYRLVVTGTPVENSSLELWSQFAFLNPGLLGNLEFFKREYVNPIEKQGDIDAAKSLRKIVYPFILRRTKEQVAPELPPRSERVLFVDMKPTQRKLYIKTRDQYRDILHGLIHNRGLNEARFKVLEGLLRLRQISNHPKLVDADYRGSSSKMELLIDQLETLRSEGHKALIFSQFVQMLKLVEGQLIQKNIAYAYLDGQTGQRQIQVDRFQADPEIPFFLISLRAGGVGLNLTAADYVIHIDPWWNPAVEMQATDRTHRIGQEKPVFVYKLIARDTVEEKILTLQDRKRKLVDQIITTEKGFMKTITPEDIDILFS